jgi:hypothetical protein
MIIKGLIQRISSLFFFNFIVDQIDLGVQSVTKLSTWVFDDFHPLNFTEFFGNTYIWEEASLKTTSTA